MIDTLKIFVSVVVLMSLFVFIHLATPQKTNPNEKSRLEKAQAQDLEAGMSKAVRKYLRAHDYNKAISLIEVMVNKDRADKNDERLSSDLQALASCYTETGDYFAANRCFKEAIETYQSMGKGYRGGLYQTLTQFATSLRKQKRDKEAAIYEKQAQEIQAPGILRTISDTDVEPR